MAERGNTTHGPHVDDQMKHETQGLIHGNRPTRAEDWREAETMDDGADLDPAQNADFDPGIDPESGLEPDADTAVGRNLTDPAQENARAQEEQ